MCTPFLARNRKALALRRLLNTPKKIAASACTSSAGSQFHGYFRLVSGTQAQKSFNSRRAGHRHRHRRCGDRRHRHRRRRFAHHYSGTVYHQPLIVDRAYLVDDVTY